MREGEGTRDDEGGPEGEAEEAGRHVESQNVDHAADPAAYLAKPAPFMFKI